MVKQPPPNIETKAINKQINSLRTSRSGPIIPALTFADDCNFFTSANKNSLTNLKNTIIDFCYASGQELNTNKSAIYFSPHTSKFHRRRAKLIL